MNAIRNTALKIGRDIRDQGYGEIFTIYKHAEIGYYLVKWKSEIYNFQSSRNLGNDFIKVCELVCDEVYLNPLANFKQWYTPYENPTKKTVVRLNTVILTKR